MSLRWGRVKAQRSALPHRAVDGGKHSAGRLKLAVGVKSNKAVNGAFHQPDVKGALFSKVCPVVAAAGPGDFYRLSCLGGPAGRADNWMDFVTTLLPLDQVTSTLSPALWLAMAA